MDKIPVLPNFKEEAKLFYNVATGDGEPLKELEEALRSLFADGMRYLLDCAPTESEMRAGWEWNPDCKAVRAWRKELKAIEKGEVNGKP